MTIEDFKKRFKEISLANQQLAIIEMSKVNKDEFKTKHLPKGEDFKKYWKAYKDLILWCRRNIKQI